ncbi:MAG: aminotransferase class I/II-fold pyridoxal phosphate-dependent enzyme [Actinomycetota bacterium]
MQRIHLSPPFVGDIERQALLDAFDSGWIAPVGPELAAFETAVADRIGWPGACALSSGSAALHLALLAVGVEPGDDVFVSSFTFAASANAVTYCGATPVFIDSEPNSWNMSPALLVDALADAAEHGRLPAAVMVVDLYGQPANYDAIRAVCDAYGVPIVEDAAEALGAAYRGTPAGTLGDVGVFSFNGNKMITTSGGGMLVAADVAIADRARHLATQARQPVAHYEHDEIGFNYRMSNLVAAVGRAQMTRLDDIKARKLAVRAGYGERFAQSGVDGDVEFMPVPEWSDWNGWLTCITVRDAAARDRVIAALAADDIESRPLWKPMHLQPVFADHRAHMDGTSERLFERGLCLPSGAGLTDADLDRICGHVIGALTRTLATTPA